MTRNARLLLLLDAAILLCYAFFLWAPWSRNVDAGPATLAWLALPVALARRGFTLASATITVTIIVLTSAALGAMLSIAGRLRRSTAMWAVGAWLFGGSVAILMPSWTAVGFLGTLLLLVVLRSRFSSLGRTSALAAVLNELCPLGYAAGFAVLAWRYNPQLLLKCLLISFGASLVGHALLPTPSAERA